MIWAPFNTDNWSATEEQCELANEAAHFFALEYFKDIYEEDPDDVDEVNRRLDMIANKISNAISDGLTAREIVAIAML